MSNLLCPFLLPLMILNNSSHTAYLSVQAATGPTVPHADWPPKFFPSSNARTWMAVILGIRLTSTTTRWLHILF